MLPCRARVDLGAMPMKGCSIFPKSPSDCLMSYPGHSLGGGGYLSAEVQSVYSTTPANWAKHHLNFTIGLFSVIFWTLLREGRSYPSVEVQSMYSTAPVNREKSGERFSWLKLEVTVIAQDKTPGR